MPDLTHPSRKDRHDSLSAAGMRLAEEAMAFLASSGPGSNSPHGDRGRTFRLLVPYTDTQAGEAALATVVELAAAVPLQVRVLHLRRYTGGRGGPWFLRSREEAYELTHTAVTRLLHHGVAATGMVANSPSWRVAHEIATHADDFEASGILLGTRPRNRLVAMLKSSISRRVMRFARCPVIVVPADGDSRPSRHLSGKADDAATNQRRAA